MEKIAMAYMDKEHSMTYQEFDHWLIERAKGISALRGDRSLQQEAKQSYGTAQGAAGTLGATAGQVGGQLIPGLERMATNPPGMSPNDLANMQARNQEAAGGTAGALKGALATRAMRMRNPAGLSADTAAVSEGASRAQGQGVQDILAQNAELKQKQQMGAQGELSGIYGADTKSMLDAMGLGTSDINAGVNAQKVGWLQNVESAIDPLLKQPGNK